MELLQTVFTSLWEGLDTLVLPILNISIRSFLLGTFCIILLIKLIYILLGMHSNSDKS